MHTNVSKLMVSAMLVQNLGGKYNLPIAYASWLLNNGERNYTIMEREALAVIYALHKFCHYLLANKFVFYVNHMVEVKFNPCIIISNYYNMHTFTIFAMPIIVLFRLCAHELFRI